MIVQKWTKKGISTLNFFTIMELYCEAFNVDNSFVMEKFNNLF